MNLYWLQPAFDALRAARAAGRFPHALLIHDARGGGGEELALQAARTALCSVADAPCGRCRDCQRVTRRTHPDLYSVAPADGSKFIGIDQIRELGAQLALTSHDGANAVAILQPADAMQAPAANALLKTLEEPRPGVTLVLQTESPSRLLPTLLSRCLRLRVQVPRRDALLAWLQQQRGAGDWQSVLAVLGEAPLLAVAADPAALGQLRRDTLRTLQALRSGAATPLDVAAQWSRGDDYLLRLACIENWITLQIDSALRPHVPANSEAIETSQQRVLPEPQAAPKITNLIRIYDALRELVSLAVTPVNRSLAVEQLLWQLIRGERAAA